MRVLGIESSCDETGLALFDTERGLIADALHSQVDLHATYGGVVPELASRDHSRRLLPLLESVLAEASWQPDDLDGVGALRTLLQERPALPSKMTYSLAVFTATFLSGFSPYSAVLS